jgi:hypothetical protein
LTGAAEVLGPGEREIRRLAEGNPGSVWWDEGQEQDEEESGLVGEGTKPWTRGGREQGWMGVGQAIWPVARGGSRVEMGREALTQTIVHRRG